MSIWSQLFGPGQKNKSVIGIDIGTSSLKVVQLRKKGGTAVLETYGELALGPYAGSEVGQATNLPADKIAETLRDLLREANVTTTDAGISIPFSRSLLTLVELPRRENEAEQKNMIMLEARKYIPVPVSEVQLDSFVVPEPVPEGAAPSQKIKALIVAVQNDELTLLQSVVEGAQIQASFFEIEIFSTIRAIMDDQTKPVMIMDIGASATKVYIVDHGIVADTHNIPQGGQDVTRTIAHAHGYQVAKAEVLKKEHGFAGGEGIYERKAIEIIFSRIFEEARKVLAQYETTQGKKVERVLLTGGGGVTKGLNEFARTFFSVEILIADPFGKVEAPAFMRPVLKDIGPEFAVAVGLALRKLEELP
jgi:type IV pilus assembly protein PilM